jgi:hypothetical protein
MDQTCRHLHTLAFDKQVWLALMDDLEARLFLDRPPEQRLRDLTTTELINLAKRMVHARKRGRIYLLLGPLAANMSCTP